MQRLARGELRTGVSQAVAHVVADEPGCSQPVTHVVTDKPGQRTGETQSIARLLHLPSFYNKGHKP